MASTRFKINPGWFEEALKGSIADGACAAKAEETLARAKGSAPVETGAYAASIHLVVEDHPQRKAWHVVAGVEYAMVVEAKTGNLARSL
jgi:hypothetical protein